MSRTTLDLEPSVLRELRARGRREGKSLGTVASELLAQALTEMGTSVEPPAIPWVTRSLGAPRVDLGDKEAVRRVLDEDG